MSDENRAATNTENNQELVASTNDHEVDDDPHTNLTQPMATSEDDNMESPPGGEAKDTPSQLNHLDSGIGMMEEDEPETPKSSDDVKTGFVKAAVEHIEKQSGIDAPAVSSHESVKAVESIPNIQAMPPKKRKTEETQADEGCPKENKYSSHMTAFDPTKPVFGVSLSGQPSENASSINNTLKEAKVTPGDATVEDKIMEQMESIHGPTEQGDKASTSSGTSADDTAASNTSAAVSASGDTAAEPAAKRFKVDMHVQRDAVNNYDAKIVHHTLAGQTPANSPSSSPSHRTCQMPPTVQYSGGNDSYSSHVAAANALDQTLSAKQAQTTPLAFPTLPINLQPNRAAVIQPPVLANREQALEGSLDETPPVAKRQLFAGGPSAHTGYKQGPALLGHNQVPVLMGYKQKKDRVSYSKKSGISFPVSRTMAKLRNGRYANHIQIKAGIYMAAVLEYLVAEVLELSGAFAKKEQRVRITPRHIMLTLRMDRELDELTRDVTLPQAGVTPCIHPALLPPHSAPIDTSSLQFHQDPYKGHMATSNTTQR